MALSIYWGDLCGRVIDISPSDADNALCKRDQDDDDPDAWSVGPGATCNDRGLAEPPSKSPIFGPMCGFPASGQCSLLPSNTTAAEIVLQVKNSSLTEGPFTGYNISLYSTTDCAGESTSYVGPTDSLPNGTATTYVWNCFTPPSGTWQSFFIHELFLN